MKDDQKNLFLFLAIAVVLLFAWQPLMSLVLPHPAAPPPAASASAPAQQPAAATPQAPAGSVPSADASGAARERGAVLAESPRVRIDTPTLQGSINLKGARIDDLVLKHYKETVAKDSPPIRLLSPAGAKDAYFARFGWEGSGLAAPDQNTLWTASGDVLAPGKPVTLDADNGQGQHFRIEFSVDDGYMFTIRQSVSNGGSAAVPAASFAKIFRNGVFDHKESLIHIGPIAAANDQIHDVKFTDLDKAPTQFDTKGGWLGFTDKYWMTALVPDQGAQVHGRFLGGAGPQYQADFARGAAQLAPGATLTQTSRFFAGAKETKLIDHYNDDLKISLFEQAIDWGWFRIIEKPIFYYLDWLFHLVGNFGVAIMLLTITIRGLLFPIANKQFESMARMRVIQPKMKALQERYKDDKAKQQQEIMKLYKEEKVNPLAGCLPLVLQIPIMFALYKVLVLTIEMRHQPFILWIHDLSAPDPATILNLFGLLPFTPTGFFAIGVIPVLLGVSMFFQMRLNPAPMDEVQKQVFQIMPWMLMFIMAPFAVGLQVYWITSNLITIAQQQWLYSRHPHMKVAVPKAGAK